jgi:hypothetical protein
MEKESVGTEPKTQNGFRDKLTTALRVMGEFIGGLAISSYFGSELLAIRMPHSNWRFAPFLILSIVLVLGLIRKDDTKVRVVSGCLWPVVVGGCVAGLFFMRAHDWVPLETGALFAIFFWARSKSTKRPYLFSSVGSLLAGVLSLEVPWPIEQRCLLTFVGVGLAVSLQGALIILRYLQGDRPAEFSEPAASSNKSSDIEMVRFMHLIFGTIDHVQIFSPELEQRVRARYQSEISQLQVFGFDYQFSDGETIPLFRLALIFPALVAFVMLCKREVFTIHDGTKYLVGHPVFVSKNKTAFAEPSGLGTKFYTAFQDGSLLISTTYAVVGMPAGPMIERHGQKASISETWASHQQRIEALEAEGKRVDRQTSYLAYAKIEHKETAPL